MFARIVWTGILTGMLIVAGKSLAGEKPANKDGRRAESTYDSLHIVENNGKTTIPTDKGKLVVLAKERINGKLVSPTIFVYEGQVLKSVFCPKTASLLHDSAKNRIVVTLQECHIFMNDGGIGFAESRILPISLPTPK